MRGNGELVIEAASRRGFRAGQGVSPGVSAQKGRRAANRQEEAQQRQAHHHFGHQYTIWKTEGVDEDTGQRVLYTLKPDRWRRATGKDDGSMEAVFEKLEDGTERAWRSVWTRLTRLLYIEPYVGNLSLEG